MTVCEGNVEQKNEQQTLNDDLLMFKKVMKDTKKSIDGFDRRVSFTLL